MPGRFISNHFYLKLAHLQLDHSILCLSPLVQPRRLWQVIFRLWGLWETDL